MCVYVCKYTLRFVKEDNEKGRGNEVETQREREKKAGFLVSLCGTHSLTDTYSSPDVVSFEAHPPMSLATTRRLLRRQRRRPWRAWDERKATREKEKERKRARARDRTRWKHTKSTLTLYITLIMWTRKIGLSIRDQKVRFRGGTDKRTHGRTYTHTHTYTQTCGERDGEGGTRAGVDGILVWPDEFPFLSFSGRFRCVVLPLLPDRVRIKVPSES